jgi:hypothetical protein
MDNVKTEFEKLNAEIIVAHNAHYNIFPNGLINIDESPNGNIVYHFYSTGEISQQKGGSAYLQRGEFITHGKLSNYKKLGLIFPNQAADGSTYVILTEEECKNFRYRMCEQLKKV